MSKLLLAYFSFVIACLVVIVAFITAATYTQLAIAILLYPLLVFFAYKVFPKTWMYRLKKLTKTQPVPGYSSQTIKQAEKFEEINRESVGISDIDKRVFLKLIGGAGLFLFFFSIFNKKAENLFFKNLPGSVSGKISLEDISGNKIDPSQNHPTDGYIISEIDDNLVSFYGYTNKDGAWYIARIATDTGSFRYIKGDSDFPGNWNNRVNLKYDYFSKIFNT